MNAASNNQKNTSTIHPNNSLIINSTYNLPKSQINTSSWDQKIKISHFDDLDDEQIIADLAEYQSEIEFLSSIEPAVIFSSPLRSSPTMNSSSASKSKLNL